jgi:hypothetical protein
MTSVPNIPQGTGSLIGQISGHPKAGCSAVKFFDDHDCAFGLRLWTAHLTKTGAVPKGTAKKQEKPLIDKTL